MSGASSFRALDAIRWQLLSSSFVQPRCQPSSSKCYTPPRTKGHLTSIHSPLSHMDVSPSLEQFVVLLSLSLVDDVGSIKVYLTLRCQPFLSLYSVRSRSSFSVRHRRARAFDALYYRKIYGVGNAGLWKFMLV